MDAAGAPAETHAFQAEVAELLNLMVHSVYSETDIFLRELDLQRLRRLRQAALRGDRQARSPGRRRQARDPPRARQGSRHARHRRHRHRHGPPGADRQSRHRRPLRHQGLPEGPGRGQGRRQPDRPVRRRLLCRLHGRRPHRSDQPPRRRRPKPGCGPRPAAPGSSSRRQATSRPSACRAAPRSGCISRKTPSATSSRSSSSAWCGPTPTTSSFRSSFSTTRARPARSMRPALCGSGRNPRSSRRTTPRPTARSPWPSTSRRSRCITRWRAGSPTPCCCSCPRRRPSTSAIPTARAG